ncbi:unnamed protein product [Rodentolepis nana]|uniref:Uncharacterized protein n=1 Tax=Rodentolepis nana TaxID=102285 RepID=A0A3P7RRN8_RODNA|nr:unnamed protein product [Rodentolepis nana]
MVAKCRCSANFGGADCERPRDICATTTCAAPRICVPSQSSPLSQHACVCPLPWTGPNCDRLSRSSISSSLSSSGSDACFSDACFLQREKGPLQFTGGSFVHWVVGNPNEYKIEIAFSIRTRQQSGPLFAVNWNALRAFRIHLVNNSNLAVSPVDFTTGKPINDWIVSSRTQLGDGQWHRVRFVLFASATDLNDLRWWVELAIDGAQTHSKLINWLPGDTERQDVLFGAELVHGFRPLAEVFYPDNWMKNDQSGPVDADWPQFDFAAPPAVLRFGFVGCIKDVLINRVKPPYQLGLSTQQAVLSAMQNRKSTVGALSDEDRGIGGLSVLQVVRIHKLEYQCSSQKTYEGSCAYAPCLNGGTCTSRRALAFTQIDRGPAAIRPSDFNCTCQAGFQGSLCEETTDICRLQPCLNGGNCEPVNGKSSAYQCICPQGFRGVHCEKSTNNSNTACSRAEAVLTAVPGAKSVPLCNHGAACLDTSEGPACVCPLGWRGGRCEYDVDECHMASMAYAAASAAAAETEKGHYRYPDLSGPVNDPLCNTYGSRRGVCINLPGSYQCNCSLGYAGRNCQIRNLTPLKPDSNALGLTPMHGYIIAGIFAIIFLVAVITVVILTCCFRRRSPLTNHFYTTRNDGQSNSSFFPGCEKMLVAGLLQPQQQQQVKLLSDSGTRMLPDGGDGSVTYSPTRTLGGSMILGPGRPLLTPDIKRQSSYFMDENGRLMLLRPNSVIGSNGGPGEPLKMVYLGGGTSGTMSPVPVGYMPATTTLARRSFIDCGMQHRVAPMTPQHLSQVHLAPHSNHIVHLQHPGSSSVHQQPRPGSSNTMTSDRISLGSGSDQFSVQSGGPRGVQGQAMMSPQSQNQQTPSSAQQQVFYVYPQSTTTTRPSQFILPHQMLPSEAPPVVFYRPEGNNNSVGNLSASGRPPLKDQRLSMIGTHKAGRVINYQSQLIPLQVIPNGPTIRPAASLNFVQNIRPRAISPPTVQSHPYWAESTLSLLPPLPPSALANQLTAAHQNPRTSLYRKAATSNADLRRPNRLIRQRNSLVIDGEPLTRDLRATQRPQSVCTPLLLANGSGEACSNPAEDLENNMHWDNQAGSTPSSAFVIAEPRGLQKVPMMRQTPVISASRQESLNGSANTLAAPILAADSQPHQPSADGTLKASPRIKGDREEPASNGVKTNGLKPRPLPPNVIIGNGNDNDTSKSDALKSNTDNTYLLKPLLENSDDGHVGTLKKQNQ